MRHKVSYMMYMTLKLGTCIHVANGSRPSHIPCRQGYMHWCWLIDLVFPSIGLLDNFTCMLCLCQERELKITSISYGSTASTLVLGGRPLSAAPRLDTSWWTAAFARPYPIIPAVPCKAAWAPVRASKPPLENRVERTEWRKQTVQYTDVDPMQ